MDRLSEASWASHGLIIEFIMTNNIPAKENEERVNNTFRNRINNLCL